MLEPCLLQPCFHVAGHMNMTCLRFLFCNIGPRLTDAAGYYKYNIYIYIYMIYVNKYHMFKGGFPNDQFGHPLERPLDAYAEG